MLKYYSTKKLLLSVLSLFLISTTALAGTRYNPFTNKQDFTGFDTQNTDCSTFIAEGYSCWDNDDNVLYVGDGVAANAVGGGTPGGSDTQLQYNNASAFGGISGATTDGTSLAFKNGSTSAGYVDFYEDSDNGSNRVRLSGPASTADITLTLPSSDGDANQYLQTDGSGNMSWATVSAGSGDITSVGDCTTGATFDGACGNTLTFDTNGGASGVDAIITQDQTNNWIDLKGGGVVDSGSTYEPVVRISNIATNANAITYFDPNNGAASLFVGASHSGYGHIIHHTGAAPNVGTGLMFYNKVVYPSYMSGTEAALRDGAFGDLSVDDIITLGTSGKRFQQLWLSDELIVGSDLGGRANIDGQADEVQIWIQGHSTQTNEIVLVEASDGTDNFKINNAGEVYVRDMNTGGNAGTDVCIDANNRLCACGTCA